MLFPIISLSNAKASRVFVESIIKFSLEKMPDKDQEQVEKVSERVEVMLTGNSFVCGGGTNAGEGDGNEW